MVDARRIGLDEVVAYFQEIEDPRSEINRKHPLASVVVIALIAVLAGASGPTAIAQWAAIKGQLLASVLPLPHGVPCKDVFRRVLMALRPEVFQACFAAWVRSLREEAAAETGVERPMLAIDGTTLRRSHDRKNGLGALHSVTVWASEYGLSLGQVACAEKSNEITAIPELLKLVDVSGGVVTIDAMGCQKEIAGGDRRRESGLRAGAQGEPGDAARGGRRSPDEPLGRGFHGRRGGPLQDRGDGPRPPRDEDVHPARSPEGPAGGQGVAGIEVDRRGRSPRPCVTARPWTRSATTLSSLPVEAGAATFAHAVRSHWGVENGCHWTLDVTFREDESRIRTKHLRENMAWLNRFSLSLLKQHPGRQSVAMKRRSCGWSDDYLMQVVIGSTS